MNRPSTLEEYLIWAKEHIGSDFDDPRIERVYKVNLTTSLTEISNHSFFSEMQSHLEKWNQDYFDETGTQLLMEVSSPRLIQKPYKSAVDKSFRVNVIWNENFPDEPKKGWVTADNIYYYFNDLIRCAIVCRFIDGPRYLTDRLMKLAKGLKLERRRYTQERDEGYYAYHYYIKFPLKFLDPSWEELAANLEIEIQATTQLQDVLRSLTHSFYQVQRLSDEQGSSKWKWEFKSNRFRVGYLSHTLHLLESIILESREQLMVEKNDAQSTDEGKTI